MNRKMILKIAADVLMTAALPLLMCYSLVGEFAHEIIGIIMFALFIAHHALNFGWIKSLFKGKYTIQKTVNTAVNITIFVCMLGLMCSGIIMSKHIFTFLRFGSAAIARTVHMLCAYWGFLLMSLHLGMHIHIIVGGMKLKKSKSVKIAVNTVFGIISALGIYFFIQLRIFDYMFMRSQFVFLDFSVPVIVNILKYVTIMVLYAQAGYFISLFLRNKK